MTSVYFYIFFCSKLQFLLFVDKVSQSKGKGNYKNLSEPTGCKVIKT